MSWGREEISIQSLDELGPLTLEARGNGIFD